MRRFLAESIEQAFKNGLVDADARAAAIRTLSTDAEKIARGLFGAGDSVGFVDPVLGTIKRRRLREPNRREFDFLVVEPKRRPRKKRTCFLGHRFSEPINDALRHNLRHLLEPYGVRLDWSGQDPRSEDVFRSVLQGIRKADFCVFDNLGTRDRPNVYIEVGIAYALGCPLILCECVGKKLAGRGLAASSVPSDLRNLLVVRYRSYEDMCRSIYSSLPVFLRRLPKSRRRRRTS